MEVKLSAVLVNNRPTNQPTDRPTDHWDKLGHNESYTSNGISKIKQPLQ